MGEPIVVNHPLSLDRIGIAQSSINFLSVTLASQKYIVVREDQGDQVSIKIIDMENGNNVQQIPVRAGNSAIMNPVHNILAIVADTQMQVYNLTAQPPQKEMEFNMKETVRFWKWVTPKVIAIITPRNVYHWTLGEDTPVKICECLDEMSDHQIINYHVNHDLTWMVVCGIKQDDRGNIVGNLQLYSTTKKMSQSIPGHVASFAKAKGKNGPYTLFCFASRNPGADSVLMIIDVERKDREAPQSVALYFPPESGNDFPVALVANERYSIIYLVTKEGFLHLYDLESGKCVYMNRISMDAIFVSAQDLENDGVVCVNFAGRVLSASVNDNVLIPHIMSQLQDIPLAMSLACRANLPGADDLFKQQFAQLWQQKRYNEAGKVAADSPKHVLRNIDTIRLFQSLPSTDPNAPPPIYNYFSHLLDAGQLSELETMELCVPLLNQGRKDLVEGWLAADKLYCTEEFGDAAKSVDLRLSISIYHRAKCVEKVIALFAEVGQYDQMVSYAKSEGVSPNWANLLQTVATSNPTAASNLARMLITAEGGSMVDINTIIDVFVSRNLIQELNNILLRDVLGDDKPEDAALQTRLLEVNIKQARHIAEAIFQQKVFSQYDRSHIAKLCEEHGLGQWALAHYSEYSDIKRLLFTSPAPVDPEIIIGFFANLNLSQSMECFRELLSNDTRNMPSIITVAVHYTPSPQEVKEGQLTPHHIISLISEFDNPSKGIYHYLKQIISTWSMDQEAVFKFIEAAAKTGNMNDVEMAIKEYEYEPERVKEFLKGAQLSDQRPLVIVCNMHGYIADLTHYLYKSKMVQYIEVFVKQINPAATPAVVGALLDEDCPESFIQQLINSVGYQFPIDELVDQVEQRHKLLLLQPWLKARFDEGNTEPAIHNALAKIIIRHHKDARENFLSENNFYDSKVVGKYAEKHDPHLAVLAYHRGIPDCDEELIAITNKHSLFKQQARYLIERQDDNLWAIVLDEENEHRRQLIDEIVQTALPESNSAEKVSATVKAFMLADLPNELIELLEKVILLEQSSFSDNRNLQNLLVLTAIKSDHNRVMGYIKRLDNYEPEEIAKISKRAGLYEEAFVVYKKFNKHVEAIKLLAEEMDDIDRAADYAEECHQSQVYSTLAQAEISAGLVSNAIKSFVRAEDPKSNVQIIQAAKEQELFEELASYLQMCRKKLNEPSTRIDSELAFCYARTNNLSALEKFITSTNSAQLHDVGDECLENEMLEAAKLIFTRIQNYSRLASTLLALGEYSSAVDAARTANTLGTWIEVNRACVEAGEFRLAETCGTEIIVAPDDMEELARFYETLGHTDQLISLLEYGLGLNGAHRGMFTEVALLYSKYKPEKLMEHIKLFHSKINTQKVCLVCEANQQWNELVFLHQKGKEHNKAALVMLEHPEDAWDDLMFKEILKEVTQGDIFYDTIKFYLEFYPNLLEDIMHVISTKVDPVMVVARVRRLSHLPLIKKYLSSVQERDIKEVNEALNEIYIEEEDYHSLRESVINYGNFDSISLARSLKGHDLLELRRIAVVLYKENGRWEDALNLLKEDNLHKEAMTTAEESGNSALAEDLLQHFVDIENKYAFAACLYTCYDLLRPDVVLEYAWKNNYIDFAFPYIIQFLREYTEKVDNLVEAQQAPQVIQDEFQEFAAPSPGYPGASYTGSGNYNPNTSGGEFINQPPSNSSPGYTGVGASYSPF
eukprot:TRINITY_DN8112_c0_g1_i1.p1 TRINITY_DN8112_c0_g1~~TRINITY_DN8112_c0_g1_i1.p1  ORF type:complete len:1694 (-),score=438.93 TRINITY_DN8112_c0_g1_i1:54-5135(-)